MGRICTYSTWVSHVLLTLPTKSVLGDQPHILTSVTNLVWFLLPTMSTLLSSHGMHHAPHCCIGIWFPDDPAGNRTRVTSVKGTCLSRLTTGPESALLYFIRVIKADLLKWKLGSFSVVVSTNGKVFISMDLAPRLCLTS